MKFKIIDNLKKIVSEEFKFWEVIILLGLTAVVGVSTGGFIVKKNYGISNSATISTPLEEFINNYNYIVDNYFGELNEEELLNGALEGILEEIDDPYAAYMDETESENFDIILSGSYRGVGIEVSNLVANGQLIITNIFKNSPAEKAGLHVGDIVLKLNDEDISEMTSSDFASRIKKIDDSFILTILRNDEEIKYTISLDTIVIESVEHTMFEDKIGYIYISVFANNTYQQLKDALNLLAKQGMQSLIIDLRGNTGGYLSSVENILGLFLDSSRVIYQIQDKTGVKKFYSNGKQTVDYEIILLTNGETASASEILVAALKEELGAISVGKKTYGKGSAQKMHTLSDGSKYKFTTQKWLTPSGKSIDRVGISVDYDVELDDVYYDSPVHENDNQLQFAIERLNN